MKTAVEWLVNELYTKIEMRGDGNLFNEILEQAKEMEKERMLNAFEESRLTHPMIGFKHETFKDYYNETFNTNEK
jgi:hypothetical protein